MSLPGRLSALAEGRDALPEKDPVRGWIARMHQAAKDSLACGLYDQAELLCSRTEAALARARARLALAQEREAMRIELEWEPPGADAGAYRQELSRAVRSGRFALPPVEVPQVLERVATLALPELMELRTNLNWRRLRWLRSRRRPWNKPAPASQDQTVGLYNRQGVTGDVLETAAREAPLWVDDLLELERRFASVDAMLGLK
jgi:hypothetical protein